MASAPAFTTLPSGLRALGWAGRWAVQGLSVAGRPRLSILIFHRVLPRADPIFPAELDAERFDRLMALVARSFQVLPLTEGVQRLAQGSLPTRALSITFDDGYADNHDVALPILRRHGLPACFFIATGFLGGGRMFNDTVIECVRNSSLDEVDLGAFGLGPVVLGGPARRAAVIAQLLAHIKYLTPQQREPALDELRRRCRPTHLPDDLMMTEQQVRAMHRAGMEIGAHTVHHPILASLDDAQAEQEIRHGRECLQSMIDAPVSLFAYPNGRPDRDYVARHADMVRRLGFRAAFTTAPGATGDKSADPFQLPRFTPWDTSPTRWMGRLVGQRRHGRFATASRIAAAGEAVA